MSRSLGAVPVVGVGLAPVFYACFVVLPLVDVAIFAFCFRAYADVTRVEAPGVGRVYVPETLMPLGGEVANRLAQSRANAGGQSQRERPGCVWCHLEGRRADQFPRFHSSLPPSV